MVTRGSQNRSQPSKSYFKFEKVILRSRNLVSLHNALKAHLGASDRSLDFSDLLRAAVVISVAAMDAYFTDIFAERLVPYLKKKRCGHELAQLLEEAGLTTGVALDLLQMNRPYRRIRTLIEGHLERQVTQRIDGINALFDTYGIEDLCGNAQAKLKRKRLCAEIKILVQRRHDIAHEGDLDRHEGLRLLKHTWVRNRLRDVQLFVGACDEILRSQLG